jgi:glycosyltransferase involved in cell wall biosynthesis
MLLGAANALSLRRFLLAQRPDVCHLLGLFPLLGPDLWMAVAGVPKLVISTWGLDVIDFPAQKAKLKVQLVRKLLLKQASAVTATSQFLRQETAKYTNKPIKVIPYGVELERFRPGPRPLGRENIVCIGFAKALAPQYGPEVLIRSIPIVLSKVPQARFLFAGTGPQLPALKKLALQLGIARKVDFVGQIPYAHLPAFLSRLNIFVMPSLTEAFGVVALEAAAMGLPVIATRIGGIPEVVIDQKTGLLVPPNDHQQLASAIIRLAVSPQLCHQLGQQGKEMVTEKFNWWENVRQMEEVYHQVQTGRESRLP